jgi:hypothetical protein
MSAVWMSKGRFDDGGPSCVWGSEGRTARMFAVPPPDALLIVYDQDTEPVELWRVGSVTRLDPITEAGWTWFAETTMSALMTTSDGSGITGIAFQDLAIMVLPSDGGWMGKPIELDEGQIADFFDYLAWPDSLRTQ